VDGDISTNITGDAIAQRHFVIEIFSGEASFSAGSQLGGGGIELHRN